MTPIRLACKVDARLPLDQLSPFQGDLKIATKEELAKLKAEILETGFAFPVHFWSDPEGIKAYIVGGHQRVTALRELRDEGHEIEGGVPVVEVLADSFQLAKRRVLQDVAQYAKVGGQALFDFITDAGLPFSDIKSSFEIPGINLENFERAFFTTEEQRDVNFKAKTGAVEMNEGQFSTFDHTCPRCNFGFNGE